MLDDEKRSLLGAFVRARREGLKPEAPGGRRRTPGLRREELAERAGIGTTWVAWIEQGREVRPSATTLARLADGLALSAAERSYLFALAERADPANPFTAPAQDAPATILACIEGLAWPAYCLDPAWQVCAANGATRDLFVALFEGETTPNLLRYAFTHPAARALLPDWERRALRLMSEFRRDYGRRLTDPRVHGVVDWLLEHSPLFRDHWGEQSVMAREGGERSFRHPRHGLLRFTQHTLADVERPDFRLVVLRPAPAHV